MNPSTMTPAEIIHAWNSITDNMIGNCELVTTDEAEYIISRPFSSKQLQDNLSLFDPNLPWHCMDSGFNSYNKEVLEIVSMTEEEAARFALSAYIARTQIEIEWFDGKTHHTEPLDDARITIYNAWENGHFETVIPELTAAVQWFGIDPNTYESAKDAWNAAIHLTNWEETLKDPQLPETPPKNTPQNRPKTWNYKENRAYIGTSDIASLTVRFPDHTGILNFGSDSSYKAWLIYDWPEEHIPTHYHKTLSGTHWMSIYDDEGLAFKTPRNKRYQRIDVYTAGLMGVLIHFIGEYSV